MSQPGRPISLLTLGAGALVSIVGIGLHLACAEEFNIPAAFEPESRFYRGTSEKDASIVQILQMIAQPSSLDILSSHRGKTLKRLHADWSVEQLRAALDADLAYFRSRGRLLSNLAACHSFMEDCPLPGVSTMLGLSFTVPLETFPPDVAENSFGDYPENTFRFKPYDPVISTSASRSEAQVFVHGEEGYMIELADATGRHCDSAIRNRSAEACLTWQTEYADELEYPWFGYIAADELRAIEQGFLRVERGTQFGRLKKIDLQHAQRADHETLKRIDQETVGARRLRQLLAKLPICPDSGAAPPACVEPE